MDPSVVSSFGVTFAAGIVGSIIGAVYGYRSGDERLRVGNSSGIGFLLGASIGATVAVFQSMAGRL